MLKPERPRVGNASPTAVLARALCFAADKHRDQRRKDRHGAPYINHPIALLSLLCVEHQIDDPTVLCAAVLHDTVEDTEATPDEIACVFGPEVARIVAEVSDDKSLPKAERKRLQIAHAANASYQARLVKLADKTCNIRDLASDPPGIWDPERRIAYREWAREVVERLRGTHKGLEQAFDAAYQDCVAAQQLDGW